MAQLNGVIIEKLQGGLGRTTAGTDNHIAMIVTFPQGTVKEKVHNNGKGKAITSVFDAKELGIDAKFDTDNKLLVFDQIDTFFRLAPEATLYLFDSDNTKELTLFINNNPDIKGYGLNLENPTAESRGLRDSKFKEDKNSNYLLEAINKHQILISGLAKENRLIDFCIIGADGLDDYTLDLFKLQAPNISVCVACEKDNKKVSIGDALGMIAVRKVNENIGSVNIQRKPLAKRGTPDYPLTDSTLKRWFNTYLSSGVSVEAIENEQLKAIISKGYIIVSAYQGYPGYFFENSATCIDRTSDFAFIENNRVWNKASRIIRNTLLPEVKSVVKKDPTTGFIASTTVSRWVGLLNNALEQLMIGDEISGFNIAIDNKQIVDAAKPVKVKAMVVSDGIVHEFEVAVGLTNNI